MVKNIVIVLALLLFSSGENLSAQTLSDTIRTGIDLFDPSQISNEIFLRTSEDVFSLQLQFLIDDLERISTLQRKALSWKDLLSVPTLNDLDVYRILKDHPDAEPVFPSTPHVVIRSRVIVDPKAEDAPEYQSGSYRGSPVKTMSRIIAKNDDILFSLTEAKDAGEPLYLDHISGCFAIRHPVEVTGQISLEKFAAGDYSLSFGNGLLFSNGYNLLPTREVNNNVLPHSAGIRPYISSSPFRYFRGAAAEITSGIFSLSGFFSDRMIDATIDSNSIISLYTNGYHRTSSELARKEQAQSKLTGVHFSITPFSDERYLEIGATGYSLNYDKQVVADTLSSGFKGKHHAMISADVHTSFSLFSASGEYARMISDAGKADAVTASLIAAPFDFWEMSLNYRDLPVNFISPFGGTFGINSSDAQNETGLYFGSKFTIIPRSLSLFGAINIARSEDQGKGDVHYTDIRFGSKYVFESFPLQLILQLRSYGKGPAFTLTNDSLSKTSLRLDANANLSHLVKVSLRGELLRYIPQDESLQKNGSLFALKLRYKPLEELMISSGIMYFNTDSYAARLYSNEVDLPGAAPFIALYGEGFRYYLQCSYDIADRVTLSGRVAETKYEPLPGSAQVRKMTLGLQCDLTF